MAWQTHAVLNDLHFPEEDRQALSTAVAILKDVKPSRIDLLGDIADVRTMSTKFRSIPKRAKWGTLLGELKPAVRFLARLRDEFPKAEIVYHAGNHEDRIRRWVEALAPQLDGALTLPGLLGLGKLSLGFHPYGYLERLGHLRLTHGDIVRRDSGASARAMLAKYGCPVLFGHTHRGGSILQTTGRTVIGAWENFCLCDLQPSYGIGPQNWQHGFSLIHNDFKRRFEVSPIHIIRGEAILEGKVYRGAPSTCPITRR